jgi:hypothetical protein
MRAVRKTWLAVACGALALGAAAGFGVAVFGPWGGSPVVVLPGPAAAPGPIRCRVEIVSAGERRAAVQRVNTLARRALLHLAPPIHNPLVMNEDFVVARVENVSAAPVTAFEVKGQFGWVRTSVEDERGEPVEFGIRARESLLIIGGAWPGHPTVTLQPGQVVWYPFRLLGRTDLDCDVRPGTYTVRPVFSYKEAPEGTDRSVPMQPLKVRITGKDIEEWRFWVP